MDYRTKVVIVGLEHVGGGKADLPGARSAAMAFRKQLAKESSVKSMVLLTTSTSAAISGVREDIEERRFTLEAFIDAVKCGDDHNRLVVFWSGHGYREESNEHYLLAPGRFGSPMQIQVSNLQRHICDPAVAPARQTFIFDTCSVVDANSSYDQYSLGSTDSLAEAEQFTLFASRKFQPNLSIGNVTRISRFSTALLNEFSTVEQLFLPSVGKFHEAVERELSSLCKRDRWVEQQSEYSLLKVSPGKRELTFHHLSSEASLLPFHNVEIVNRTTEFERLKDLLSPDCSERRIAWVHGLSGFGKTTLAKFFALHFRDNWNGIVYWLNASGQMKPQLAALASRLPLGGESGEELERHCSRSLLVLDDLEDHRVLDEVVAGVSTLRTTFPRILVCSRYDAVLGTVSMHLGPLSLNDAIQVLVLHSGRTSTEPYVRRVCGLLGNMPLAIVLAGAFLRHYPRVSLEDYASRLEQTGTIKTVDDEVSLLPNGQLPADSNGSLGSCLDEHWEALSPESKDALARICCFVSPLGEMTERLLHVISSDLLRPSSPGHPSSLSRSLVELGQRTLVSYDALRERLVVHRIVSDYVASRTSNEESANIGKQSTNGVVNAYGSLKKLVAAMNQSSVSDILSDLHAIHGSSSIIEGPITEYFLSIGKRAAELYHSDHHIAAQNLLIESSILGFDEVTAHCRDMLTRSQQKRLELKWESGRESHALISVWRNEDPITCCTTGHSDSFVWVGTETGDVILVDVEKASKVDVVAINSDPILELAVSFDGELLVIAQDSRTTIFNLDSRKSSTTFDDLGLISCAFGKDQRLYATTWDGTFLEINCDNGSTRQIELGNAQAVVVSTDGESVTVCGSDHNLRVYSVDGDLISTLVGHEDEVLTACFGRDRLYSLSNDGNVRVWSVAEQATESSWFAKRISSIRVFEHQDSIVTFDNHARSIQLRRIIDGKKEGDSVAHTKEVTASCANSSRRLTTVSEDGALKLWRVDDSVVWDSKSSHQDEISGIVVQESENCLVTASQDGTVRKWRLDNGDHIGVMLTHNSGLKQLVNLRGQFAVVDRNGCLLMIPVPNGLPTQDSTGVQFVYSIDGQQVLVAKSDGEILLKNVVDGHDKQLLSHQNRIFGLGRFRDGKVVIADPDGLCVTNSLSSGAILNTDLHNARIDQMCISSQGDWGASASVTGEVRIWSQDLNRLGGHHVHSGAVTTLLTWEGYVVSAAEDRRLVVWSVEANRCVCAVNLRYCITALCSFGKSLLAGDEVGNICRFQIHGNDSLHENGSLWRD